MRTALKITAIVLVAVAMQASPGPHGSDSPRAAERTTDGVPTNPWFAPSTEDDPIEIPRSRLRMKLTPRSVEVVAAGEYRSSADGSGAGRLFDRDTNTGWMPVGGSSIQVALDGQLTVDSLKVFGRSGVSMSVSARFGDVWEPVPGLEHVELARADPGWDELEFPPSVRTSSLRIRLTPTDDATPGSLTEIEIWSAGSRPVGAHGHRAIAQLTNGAFWPRFRSVSGLPADGIEVEPAAAVAVDFHLSSDPRGYKRAFLVYELGGQSHWVSVSRSINGVAAAGRGLDVPTGLWAEQIEQIDPSWLRQGHNEIIFTASDEVPYYEVRNVRLVGELDTGVNFVATKAVDGAEDAARAFDADLSTGWSTASRDPDRPGSSLELGFDRTYELESVDIYLGRGNAGDLEVMAGGLDGHGPKSYVWAGRGDLKSGWNSLSLAGTPPVDGLRIRFGSTGGEAWDVREVVAVGSGTGGLRETPAIRLAYPDAGQFSGREAYIRGFVTPADNGSGPARVTIAGREIGSRNGSFEATVQRDDLGHSADPDEAPWAVTVQAEYPDGLVIRRTIRLDKPEESDASGEMGLLPEKKTFRVSPSRAQRVRHDDAVLEIDAGAVKSKIDLGVTPLSQDDLPALDQGMTNVTRGPRRGYRFEPHGMRFSKKVRVKIPFDRRLIPRGLKPKDVHIFYFDEEAGRWVALEKVGVDKKSRSIVCLTDHFTDMISATLTTPDHPAVRSFVPTTLRDVAAADPGAGIEPIAPPEITNTGDALLSFPIALPPGRQGMEPVLNIDYSSARPNGWLGMGWDLQVSSLTIDTRWGVPRYDAAMETETYLLDGEQLAPVAHRAALVARTSQKTFNTRVEGRFRKIVRHGNAPDKYWWEVTEKDGTRFIYGGQLRSGKVDRGATLGDANGNVLTWFLTEMRDLQGNGVRYEYERVSDTGVAGGTVPGTQLYPKAITYTHSNNRPGPFAVTFVRDSELPGSVRRPDTIIEARGGFKQVTADLLRRIIVTYGRDVVRSYDLDYTTGAFQKSLLESITQRGEDGSVFHTHSFTYYDDIRRNGLYEGFAPTEDWQTGADDVRLPLVDELADPLGFDAGKASALSGYVTAGATGHLYVGFNPGAPTKQGSAGGKVGFSGTIRSEDILSLIDINGDGLPDKVFKSGGDIYFRPNESGPGGSSVFGAAQPISTLTDISKESTVSVSFGAEAYFGVNGLANQALGFTVGSIYFADVNGDDLPDQVRRGQVLFNYLDAGGIPNFTPDSNLTPYPVGAGHVDGNGLVADYGPEFQTMVDNSPLQDTLRRWTAPFNGRIRIAGDVALLPVPAGYDTADGVRVAIQHNRSEIWSDTIPADDTAPRTPGNVASLAVRKGDRIYFRVGSVFEGAHDVVTWDPEITYLKVPVETDVNGLNAYRFRLSEDFVLAGRPGIDVIVPFNGTIRLSGLLQKTSVTSDDITLRVLRNGQEVSAQSAAWDEVVDLDPGQDFTVDQDDRVQLRVEVDSPIDVSAIRWTPSLFYVATARPAYEIDGQPFNVDRLTDDDGNYIIQLHPPYDVDLYPDNDLTAPQVPYTVNRDSDNFSVTTDLRAAPGAIGDVFFTVKREEELLAKRKLRIILGVVQNEQIDLTVEKGDELFFDYSIRDPDLAPKIRRTDVEVRPRSAGRGSTVQGTLHSAIQQNIFPQPYRGWAMAGYNGEGSRATAPINETDLTARFDSNSEYDPRTARAYLFQPFPEDSTWRGPKEQIFAAADRTSSARIGADNIEVPDAGSFGGARAVRRLSFSSQTALGVGASYLSGSASAGLGFGEIDYFDMNGDRFPDIVGRGRVQYSTLDGGLEGSNRLLLDLTSPRRSVDAAGNFGAGGNPASFSVSSRGSVETSGQGAQRENDTGSQMATLGIGGSLGGGLSLIDRDYIDVNGDGLPDRVSVSVSDPLNLQVALNLGYGFADPEPWGRATINDGVSGNLSLGVGLGFNSGIYGFAGGLSLDTNSSNTLSALIDINGDGLPDRITQFGTEIRVGFNTGSGFTADETWGGAPMSAFARAANTALGAGGYFTVGIGPLCVGGCYVIVNPGADVSDSISRQEVSLLDVDGDGYPDHLNSSDDASLTVARNRTGRTNLLAGVSRPLGGRFEIDYERAGNTYDMPQSRWVVSTVRLFDGVPGDGIDEQVLTYDYENGYFDRLEREFFGFGRVTESQVDVATGVPYRSMTTEYRNDGFSTKGLIRRELTSDGAGRPFVERENTHALVEIGTGLPPSGAAIAVFPQLVRTDTRFYEGEPSSSLATHQIMEYDAFGNVLRSFDAGDAGPEDDLEVLMEYSQCDQEYVVGVPVRMIVRGDGREMRRREGDVDCPTGKTRRITQYLQSGIGSETELEYSNTGNLTRVTGPPNLAGERYEVRYEFDRDVDTHVAKATDSFGYSSSAVHDPKYGHTLSVTDANGNEITQEYDVFGRMISLVGPYEQKEAVPTLQFSYHHGAAVPWALTRHNDKFRDPADTIDVATFIDGLKRPLQSKIDATVFTGTNSQPADVMIVSGRVKFDHAGRVIERYHPVTEPTGTPEEFNTAYDGTTPTRVDYDVLDRTIRIAIPDGSTGTYSYGFGEDRSGAKRFLTTATDANGVRKRTYRDVREIVAAVEESLILPNGQNQSVWTSYDHDPLDQLVEVVDDHGNLTSITFDNFGRRTAISSPDAGTVELQYDRASNVVARTTANLRARGSRISYDHEFNRVRGIRYPDFPENNVTYTYGPPGEPLNRAGRIVGITDQSGTEELFYGKLGEVTRQIKAIVTRQTPHAPESYETRYLYDTFGRLREMVYPDGEVLEYLYDSGGMVRQVFGDKGRQRYDYVETIQYDKFKKRVFLKAANGTSTRFTYHPEHRRLSRLTATKADGATFQDVFYNYDPVGNLVSLTNAVAVSRPSEFGGPSQQSFVYDSLDRLIGAEGRYQFSPNKTDRYTLAIAYDTIHGIRSKDQRHSIVQPSGVAVPQRKTSYSWIYDYSPSRPHAPGHAGNRTFHYDANGNQVGWTHDQNGTRRATVWDEENRVQSIFENGHELSYTYNERDERIIKRGPQGETVYVNPYFTIRNSQIGTKHVYVGATRIVSKLMKQAKPGSKRRGKEPREKDLYFYCPDHVGSHVYVTDADGDLYEHLEYFPFGETWVEESTNTQRTPYLFSAKELDEETGLYYFGARYYDPRMSVWSSTDPALGEYMGERPSVDSNAGDGTEIYAGGLFRLSGEDGAYRSQNLALYSYAWQSPRVFTDPDGRFIMLPQGDQHIRFRNEYRRAKRYLKKVPEAKKIIDTLESKDTKLVWLNPPGSSGADRFVWGVNTGLGRRDVIEWDPYSALKTTQGGTQSPALGLIHEMAHALGKIEGTTAKDNLWWKLKTKFWDKNYDHAEEKRVIRGIERKTATALGEAVRSDHRGSSFLVQHADEREPAKKRNQKIGKRKIREQRKGGRWKPVKDMR